MNWKNRLTNYNFWVSIVSAVILVLQALDIKFDFAYLNEVATAVLGLLVVIGIINDPTRSSASTKSTEKVNNKKTKSTQQIGEEKIENSKNLTQNNKNFQENTQNLENLENFSIKTELEKVDEEENKQDNVINQNPVLPIEQKNEIVDGDIQNSLPLPALGNEVEHVDNLYTDDKIVEEKEDPASANKNFFNIVN